MADGGAAGSRVAFSEEERVGLRACLAESELDTFFDNPNRQTMATLKRVIAVLRRTRHVHVLSSSIALKAGMLEALDFLSFRPPVDLAHRTSETLVLWRPYCPTPRPRAPAVGQEEENQGEEGEDEDEEYEETGRYRHKRRHRHHTHHHKSSSSPPGRRASNTATTTPVTATPVTAPPSAAAVVALTAAAPPWKDTRNTGVVRPRIMPLVTVPAGGVVEGREQHPRACVVRSDAVFEQLQSPFFREEARLARIVLGEGGFVAGSLVKENFVLAEMQMRHVLRAGWRVHFRLFDAKDGADMELLSTVALLVNNRPITLALMPKKVRSKNRIPFVTSRAVDLTTCVKDGMNVVRFRSPPGLQKGFAAVQLVSPVALEALCSRVPVAARAPGSQQQCDDFSVGEFKLSLMCPLSIGRISVPVKGIGCSHQRCFDLATYLQYCRQTGLWECPICSASCPYSALAIDDWFRSALGCAHRDDTFVIVHQDLTISRAAPGMTMTPTPPPIPPHVPESGTQGETPIVPLTAQARPTSFSQEPSGELICLSSDDESSHDAGVEDMAVNYDASCRRFDDLLLVREASAPVARLSPPRNEATPSNNMATVVGTVPTALRPSPQGRAAPRFQPIPGPRFSYFANRVRGILRDDSRCLGFDNPEENGLDDDDDDSSEYDRTGHRAECTHSQAEAEGTCDDDEEEYDTDGEEAPEPDPELLKRGNRADEAICLDSSDEAEATLPSPTPVHVQVPEHVHSEPATVPVILPQAVSLPRGPSPLPPQPSPFEQTVSPSSLPPASSSPNAAGPGHPPAPRVRVRVPISTSPRSVSGAQHPHPAQLRQ